MRYVVLPGVKGIEETLQTLKNGLCVVRMRYPMRVETGRDFTEVWNKDYTKKSRNMVRKAEKKGVTIQEIDPFGRLNEVLAIHKSSPTRQGRPVDPEYLDPSKVRLYFSYFVKNGYLTKTYGAFYDGKLIGYLHVFKHENIMHVGRLMSDMKHFDMAPNDVLITTMISDCCNSHDVDFAQYYYIEATKRPFLKGLRQERGLGVDHFKFEHGFKPYKEIVIVIPETLAEKVFIIMEKMTASLGWFGSAIYSLALGLLRRSPIPRLKSVTSMSIGHYYTYFLGGPSSFFKTVDLATQV